MDASRIQRFNKNQSIVFNYVIEEDDATYSCRVVNRVGTVSRRTQLKVVGMKSYRTEIFTVVLLCILLILLCLFLSWRYLKMKRESVSIKIIFKTFASSINLLILMPIDWKRPIKLTL